MTTIKLDFARQVVRKSLTWIWLFHSQGCESAIDQDIATIRVVRNLRTWISLLPRVRVVSKLLN